MSNLLEKFEEDRIKFQIYEAKTDTRDLMIKVNQVIDYLTKLELDKSKIEDEVKEGTDVEFRLFYPGIDELKKFKGKVTKVKKVAVVEYQKEDGKTTLTEIEIRPERIKRV